MTWLRAEWDRVLGFTLIALGAVLLVLGYLGVSDSPYVAEQLSYIVSGGLGGLFLFGWRRRKDKPPKVAPLPKDDDWN